MCVCVSLSSRLSLSLPPLHLLLLHLLQHPLTHTGSMSRSESKADDVRQLARSDSKALDYVDYTNAPPASEESLATTDRETLIAFRDKLENERMKMRSVFQKFDKDSSKTISPTELSQGLASLGIDLDDGQANRLCKRFDIEGDGRLHYFEFVKIFHGLPPACAW